MNEFGYINYLILGNIEYSYKIEFMEIEYILLKYRLGRKGSKKYLY